MSAALSWISPELPIVPSLGADRIGLARDPVAAPVIGLSRGRPSDVPAMLELLDEYARRGLVLPRTPQQVYRHVREFTVAHDATGLVGCAGLRIYTAELGEVSGLAVAERCQGRGVGRILVEAVVAEARALSLRRVFALTLQESFFRQLGFRTVPRTAVPEKVAADRADGIDRTSCRKVTMVRDFES